MIDNILITKLLDAVSSAIGIVYQPKNKRKSIEAKADEINKIAEVIRSNSDLPIKYKSEDIEIDSTNTEELVKRAEKRLTFQEVYKQKNIEDIVDGAYEELQDKELQDEKDVDKDWMLRFFNSVEDISNVDMKKLWSKVLAGEIMRPQSFSLRTLNVLKNLSQQEAKLFESICKNVIMMDFIINQKEINEKYKIGFYNISRMVDCGLVNPTAIVQHLYIDPSIPFAFESEKYILNFDGKGTIDIDGYKLTTAGKELYSLLTEKRDGFPFLDDSFIIDFGKILAESTDANINVSLHEVLNRDGRYVKYDEYNLLDKKI